MATISQALAIAIQHHQAGRLQAAEQIYRQILAVEPKQADAWHLLGVVANQVGKHAIAVEYIQRAIESNQAVADFHNNLGTAYSALGRLPDAIACYRRALQLKPDHADAHYNLGHAAKQQGNLDEAAASYRRALELKPANAVAQNNLGIVLDEQSKPDEAVACYRRALELKPDYAEAHSNLGNALNERGNPDEAAACCRRALELKPDSVEAYNNLGNALKDQGELEKAAACWRRALELKPDHAAVHYNQSLVLLMKGDFAHGWPEYQWRWRTKPWHRFSQPLWDGRPLEGRTILLYAEHGLGDALQFVRYAALVKQRGGTVVVECPRSLVSLLTSCAGVDRLLERGVELPPFDVQAPLSSLPGVFHTTLGDIPANVPYLFADPTLIERWRAELGPFAGLKVGIFWQGTTRNPARSIPLACFESLAGVPGVQFFSLQKGAGVEQLRDVAGRWPIVDLGGRLDDFMDTAAVMSNLDLVITCDTAVAHLAGALGVVVWTALPSVPDWRWLLDRGDSPWYPTMRLFRQERRGDWQGVFQRIQAALGEQIALRAASPIESGPA
jgi:tetratricopeptide (TPR) repeat protein